MMVAHSRAAGLVVWLPQKLHLRPRRSPSGLHGSRAQGVSRLRRRAAQPSSWLTCAAFCQQPGLTTSLGHLVLDLALDLQLAATDMQRWI